MRKQAVVAELVVDGPMPFGIDSKAELAALYEVSKILSSSLAVTSTFRQSLTVLSSFLGMHHGLVMLFEGEASKPLHVDALRILAAPELKNEEMLLLRDRHFDGLQQVIRTALPTISREPARESDKGMALSALLMVPIKADGRVLGVLGMQRGDVERGMVPVSDEIRLLTMVAQLMGQALRLSATVEAERLSMQLEQEALRSQLRERYQIANVVGHSKHMQDVLAQVHQAATGRSTVLIRGESGTGKEALAGALHYQSERSKGPFVKINCAALPESLLESELFGHEKGAFTGATHERKGRFEMAHGGTLFLDEIGTISPSFQAKLLRVLQERELERVGGQKTIKVDVRVVAATNANLEEEVARGNFRADLYFRINVVSIFLPPLRERKEDIPFLVEHFLHKFNQENGKSIQMTPEALQILMRCSWPGNVRELENCIERTATMVRNGRIRADDLSCSRNQCFSMQLWERPSHDERAHEKQPGNIPLVGMPRRLSPAAPASSYRSSQSPADGDGGTIPEPGPERVRWALEQSQWVQARAARLLGVTPRQLGYAMRKYGIPSRKL